MREGKRIDLRGWKLIERQHWEIIVIPGKNIVRVQSSRGELTSERIKLGMSVSSHQRCFGKEVINVRSVYFFGKGPQIQLWCSNQFPPPDEILTPLNFKTLKDYWWQDLYYKAVKIGDTWLQLEDDEDFLPVRFLVLGDKPEGVYIDIVKKSDPQEVIKEFAIKK